MDDEQLLRYSRHILLPRFDITGQQQVLDSRILVVGLGGLGSPVSLYLAAAGVGHLVLVDDDKVELTNLQRQILHRQTALDQLKTTSAVQTLQTLNDTINIETISHRLSEAEMMMEASAADVIVDCTDNFSSRFMLNQASKNTQTPLVSAAAIRWEGQISVFDPRQTHAPCYRCLYTDNDDSSTQSCTESGVLSPLLGLMGSMQAIETLKLLTNTGTTLNGRLLMIDAFSMQIREINLKQDPDCPVCHSYEKNK